MFPSLATLALLSTCPTTPGLTVDHDARARRITVRTSPVDLPAADTGSPGTYHRHAAATPLTRFAWPVDGWARGFRLRLTDCAGTALSRSRLHHAVVLHLGRRDLIHPIYQRLIAFTQESEDVTLPSSVGLRMVRGDSLGLLVAWMAGPEGAERVRLELTVSYLAGNTSPRPVEVVPIGFDVEYEPGGGASFDLPPGKTVFRRDFVMPIDGHMLVAGGHLHDYARSLVLVDQSNGKTVLDAAPKLNADGEILGVARRIYGASGNGVRLHSGRSYRLIVVYDNPTGIVQSMAGMGILAGLFSPRDLRDWPRLDPQSPGFLADVQSLQRSGMIAAAARHH